jgi:CcmD family protein
VRHFVRAVILAALVLAAGVHAGSAQDRPQAAQDEFVPVSELPQTEQLPAAPLVIAAYSVFWLLPFVYLWTLQRRMAAVDRELSDLRQRLGGARDH